MYLKTKVKNLLAELRQARVHMAIVLDEYKQLTNNYRDVIEEIIGDIQDEYDDEKKPLLFYLMANSNARASIYDVNESHI